MLQRYRVCPRTTPCLIELEENPKLVTIAASEYVKNEPALDREKIYCASENLFNYHYSLQSRLGYHLIKPIDDIILRLIEGGIPKRWRLLQIYENGWLNMNSSVITSLKINDKRSFNKIEDNRNEIISLNMDHFRGATFILLFGYTFSILIFILEILSKKIMKNTSNKFLLILIYFLDPQMY